MSTKPGVTRRPAASISSRPRPRPRPTSAMRPSWTATSPSNASRPVPSTTLPLRMTRSNMGSFLLRASEAEREVGAERRRLSRLAIMRAELLRCDVRQITGVQDVPGVDAELHFVGSVGHREEGIPQPVRVLTIVRAPELAEVDVVGDEPFAARAQHAEPAPVDRPSVLRADRQRVVGRAAHRIAGQVLNAGVRIRRIAVAE